MSTAKPIVLKSRTFYGPITLGPRYAIADSTMYSFIDRKRATRGAFRRALAKRVGRLYYTVELWSGWSRPHTHSYGTFWTGKGDRRAFHVGCHRFSGKNLRKLRKWANAK